MKNFLIYINRSRAYRTAQLVFDGVRWAATIDEACVMIGAYVNGRACILPFMSEVETYIAKNAQSERNFSLDIEFKPAPGVLQFFDADIFYIDSLVSPATLSERVRYQHPCFLNQMPQLANCRIKRDVSHGDPSFYVEQWNPDGREWGESIFSARTTYAVAERFQVGNLFLMFDSACDFLDETEALYLDTTTNEFYLGKPNDLTVSTTAPGVISVSADTGSFHIATSPF